MVIKPRSKCWQLSFGVYVHSTISLEEDKHGVSVVITDMLGNELYEHFFTDSLLDANPVCFLEEEQRTLCMLQKTVNFREPNPLGVCEGDCEIFTPVNRLIISFIPWTWLCSDCFKKKAIADPHASNGQECPMREEEWLELNV